MYAICTHIHISLSVKQKSFSFQHNLGRSAFKFSIRYSLHLAMPSKFTALNLTFFIYTSKDWARIIYLIVKGLLKD